MTWTCVFMSMLTFNSMEVDRTKAEETGEAMVAMWEALVAKKGGKIPVELLRGTMVALGGLIASGTMIKHDEESVLAVLADEDLMWEMFMMAIENMSPHKRYTFKATDPRVQNFATWTGYKLPKLYWDSDTPGVG